MKLMRTRLVQRRRSDRNPPAGRGQSLVEFALASPVILLLLLGTIDLGRMYSQYVALKNGAREGAGYGISKPADTAGMKAVVLAANVPVGTTPTASCTGSCSTIDGTGEVVVTASAPFEPATLGFFTWLGVNGTVTLTATAKMRALT
jgi:Flp pilus assembly protein TadG